MILCCVLFTPFLQDFIHLVLVKMGVPIHKLQFAFLSYSFIKESGPRSTEDRHIGQKGTYIALRSKVSFLVSQARLRPFYVRVTVPAFV